MESEDKKPIFTKRLILTILAIILIILIILLLLRRCGNGNSNHSVTGVTVSPLYMTLAPGESQLLQAYVEPSDADNQRITCSSSNPEVASVDPDTCLVHGISEGTAEITATSDDGGKTASCTVTVTKKPSSLTGIQLSAGTYTVKKGKSKLVSVSPTPRDAQLPDLVYSIADEAIATVNQNGVIKGVEIGTTTLVVRSADGEHSAMATVKVIDNGGGDPKECPAGQVLVDGKCVDDITEKPKPTKLDISGSKDVTLSVGDTYIIPFIITPDDALQEAICTVTDTSKVSESNCTLTALAKGSTTVKVCAKADPKICDTMKVTVTSGGSPYYPPSPKPPKPTDPSCPTCPTEVQVGEGVITIKAVTTAGNDKWHRSGKFVITVAGRITDIPRITYTTSDSAGSGNKQSGTLTSGVKTIYLDDTPGTASVTVKYTYQGKEYSISNSITKIDSKNPTCSSFKYDSGLKKIVVNASDEMSGLKSAVFSGNTVSFTGVGSATYPISSTGKYSVLIYDVAGNSTSCGSVNITDLNKDVDGKSGAIPLKLEVSTNKLDLNLNESKSVKAWILMSDNTHRPITKCTSNSPEYVECSSSGSDGSGNSNVSIKGKQEGKNMTVTVSAGPAWVEMAGGKELSATITVNVGANQKPTISMSRNYGSGSDKKGWTINVTAKANNENEVVTEVAFGYSKDGAACKTTDKRSSDVREAKVGFSVNLGENYVGKWTACATMKTSKGLTAEVSYTYDADTAGPSCDIRKYGNDKFIVTATDTGKGIRYVKVDGSTVKTLASGTNTVTVVVDSKKNVTATDWSDNTVKCTDNTGSDKATSIKVECTKYTFEGEDPLYNKSKCTAYVEPSTANQKVKWESASTYVKVDGDGNVRQVKENKGTDNIAAVIRATTDNSLSADVTIMISPSNLMDNSKVPTCSVSIYPSATIEVGQRATVSVYCSANGSTSFKRAYDKPTFTINQNPSGAATIGGNLCQAGYCGGATYFSASYHVTGVKQGQVTFNVPEGLYVNPSGHESPGASGTITITPAASELKPTYTCQQSPNAGDTRWQKYGLAQVVMTDDQGGMSYSISFNDDTKTNSNTGTFSSYTQGYRTYKNGTVTATGSVKDKNGNTTPISCTYTFDHVDGDKPTCNITATLAGDEYKLTATASDTGGSGLQTTAPAGWNGSNGTYTQLVSTPGEYTFKITDVAGNEGSCSITTDKFPSKNKKPKVGLILLGTGTGAGATVATILGVQPSATVTASDDLPGFTITSTGPLSVSGTATNTTWAKTVTLTENKTYTGTITVTDSSGERDSINYNFVVNNAGAAPQCVAHATKSTINVGDTTTVTFTCSLPTGSAGAITRVATAPTIGTGLSMTGAPTLNNNSISVTVRATGAGTTYVSIPSGAFKNGVRVSPARSVSITVNAPTVAPTCSISGAGSMTATLGGTATVNFKCSIPSGSGTLTRTTTSITSAINCNGCTVQGGNVGTDGSVTAVIKSTSSSASTASVSLRSGVYKNGSATSTGSGSVSVKFEPKTAISCGTLSYSIDKRNAYFGASVTNLKSGENVSRTISSTDATCNANGSTTIFCSTKKDSTYKLTVSVTNASGVVVKKECQFTVSGIVTASPTLTIGGNTTISTAKGTTSLTADLKNASAAYYGWRSSNTSCAKVASTTSKTVTVTGANASTSNCTTTITAWAYKMDGSVITSTTKTVVVAGTVNPSMTIGGTMSISTAKGTTSLTANLTNASAAYYGWRSSNTSCAKVASTTSKTVTVTGANTSTSACTTTITAWAYKMDGSVIKSTTATVTVAGTSSSSTVKATLTASATVESEKTIPLSGSLSGASAIRYEWTSSNTSCAKVSGSGSSATLTAAKVTTSCRTVVTVTIYYNGGSAIASDTKTITVNPATAENFGCGTVASRSNAGAAWTNKGVTVIINCTGADCSRSTFQGDWNGTSVVTTGTITISSKTGKTKPCSVDVKYDPVKPTCKYKDPGKTTWTKSSYTVSVECSDTGSGCSSYLGTRSHTYDSVGQKTVTFVVGDNAGNQTSCGDHNVYVDFKAPSLTCTITANDSANGVTVRRDFSDSFSGLKLSDGSTVAAGTTKTLTSTIKSTTNYYAYDLAGNSSSCKITVTSSKKCTTGTLSDDGTKCWGSYYGLGTPTFSAWSTPTTTYVPDGSCNAVNSSSCATCTSYTACSASGFGSTVAIKKCGDTACQTKRVYTRTVTSRTCPSGTASKTSGGSYCYNYTSPQTVYHGTK